MDKELISASDVQEWLKGQSLMYASHPAAGDKRLRLLYAPYRQTWEVTLGIGGVNEDLYLGSDVSHAVSAFNRALEAPADAMLAQRKGEKS